MDCSFSDNSIILLIIIIVIAIVLWLIYSKCGKMEGIKNIIDGRGLLKKNIVDNLKDKYISNKIYPEEKKKLIKEFKEEMEKIKTAYKKDGKAITDSIYTTERDGKILNPYDRYITLFTGKIGDIAKRNGDKKILELLNTKPKQQKEFNKLVEEIQKMHNVIFSDDKSINGFEQINDFLDEIQNIEPNNKENINKCKDIFKEISKIRELIITSSPHDVLERCYYTYKLVNSEDFLNGLLLKPQHHFYWLVKHRNYNGIDYDNESKKFMKIVNVISTNLLYDTVY